MVGGGEGTPCLSTTLCIETDALCNGIDDCRDGEDERECPGEQPFVRNFATEKYHIVCFVNSTNTIFMRHILQMMQVVSRIWRSHPESSNLRTLNGRKIESTTDFKECV